MEAPIPGGDPRPNPEANRAALEYAAQRQHSTAESLNDRLLATARDPFQFLYALRNIESRLENGTTPSSLTESYKPPGQMTGMIERTEILKKSGQDLVNLGFLEAYDENTGYGIPSEPEFVIASIDAKPITLKRNIDGKEVEFVVYNYGKIQERKELADTVELGSHELETRTILGEHIGARLHLNVRDNLNGLVEWQHGTTAKLRVEHLEALFNLSSINEKTKKVEKKELGNQIEESMFMFLIMLNSGSKDRMQSFLKRPGSNALIDRLRVKETNSAGQKLTREEWTKKYIGDLTKWKEDGLRKKDTCLKEEAGARGLLTIYGNIASYEGSSTGVGVADENDLLNKIMGGATGSAEAAWIAATLLRDIGAFASEGYLALPNGDSSLALGEGRYISSDDSGKFYHYMWMLKEGLKGRSSGLKDLIGRVPDMAMNLFDWAQVKVELPDGTPAYRSIMDAWLGTAAGIPIKNLLTGAETGRMTTMEPYHRLGDLKFDSLVRDFHGNFATMQWLMGRDGDGVLTNAQKMEFSFDKEFSLTELKKAWKYIGICFNPIIMTKGSPHLYEIIEDVKDSTGKVVKDGTMLTIQKNFFHNTIAARMQSAFFRQHIMPAEQTVYDPDMGTEYQKKVSQVALIDLFAQAVLEGNPSTQDELIKHYVDANEKLVNAGILSQAKGILKKWPLRDEVGKVTGKTKNNKLIF